MSVQKANVHVIIVAAGEGSRFGGSVPKQYQVLQGKPVLRHSMDMFVGQTSRMPRVVIHPSHDEFYKKIAGASVPVHGSETRKGSVYNALKAAVDIQDNDIVLIHDAERPNISAQEIQNLVDAMQGADAATLVVPVSDTLRRDSETVDRSGLWAVQTPQAFRFGVLKKAHETMKGEFTDDTGLVSAMGVQVKMVPGSKANIKLTTPEDMDMLDRLMAAKRESRTGMGFDVHAFSTDKNRKLVLCGIEVEHAFGLEGHSDADVAMHALTDALLGAIGEGDIGLHFPPSNMAFKNMDSRVFLEKACYMMHDKGGEIQNADVTIICEAPKITPYRAVMVEKIAEILNVDAARVNVKATTTEGLGFTGRGEGIAAQAIVTVRI